MTRQTALDEDMPIHKFILAIYISLLTRFTVPLRLRPQVAQNPLGGMHRRQAQVSSPKCQTQEPLWCIWWPGFGFRLSLTLFGFF
jgi:hypothetical protein